MYQFQIRAYTQLGEIIGLIGSGEELGNWDVDKCIRLTTSTELYPLWISSKQISFENKLESGITYKYILLKPDGSIEWEKGDANRWLPPDSDSKIMVDDGSFNYIQPYPFGYDLNYLLKPSELQIERQHKGLKILIIGSSVAEGHKSWLMRGWAALLADSLNQKYGHQVINVSKAGANISTTIARFSQFIKPSTDIVIIALSLGNEGFARCPVPQRRSLQRKFELGLQQLIKMTQEVGAIPVLAGVYPHNNYEPEHQRMLWDTHKRMLNWGVPVLNWLADLDDGYGHWQSGISFDPAHPNTLGHQIMYEAIAQDIFDITEADIAKIKESWQHQTDIYLDRNGFRIFIDDRKLRIINPTEYEYAIAPDWQELQTAIQARGKLTPGIYLSQYQNSTIPFLCIGEDGKIEATVQIPPHVDLTYTSAFDYFEQPNNQAQILFHEGDLGLIKVSDRDLWIVNESEHQYNIQPMWQEVRNALAALPTGVYSDTTNPDIPFRTMMIGNGLESRVKVPPKSALFFSYKCRLSDISRVAILPLGDRCAVRMMLYKMEFDGPAFPFDLTRTTNISDVSDAIATGFDDMWNPDFLEYNPEAGRIYHIKWQGLSFAHEVEATDDPLNDMSPIYERMRTRYSARAKRFWYTLDRCDRVLFVRTGICDRLGVIDLVEKLKLKSHNKPFQLLILSPQSSDEFLGLADVIHYELEFNPDRMHENLDHWLYCTDIMHEILTSLDISSKNLFWCPP